MATAIWKKFLILQVIWLRSLVATLEVAIITGVIAAGIDYVNVFEKKDYHALKIAIIAAIIPALKQFLTQSPVPKLPKEVYEAVKDDLSADTQQFTKPEPPSNP